MSRSTVPRKPAGHLFVVHGDLTRIAFDHVLIPTDSSWRVEPWAKSMCGNGFEAVVERSKGLKWRCEGPVEPIGGDVVASQALPQVWFGNIESTGMQSDQYRDIVDAFIKRAILGATGRTTLAINFIGSGKGGSSSDKGGLIESLISYLLDAATVDRGDVVVDLVFVANSAAVYSAAQRARQRLTTSEERIDGLGPYSHSVIESTSVPDVDLVKSAVRRLAAAARVRRLVPFVGAGVGVGAGLPRWSELIQALGVVGDQPSMGAGIQMESDDFRALDVRDQAEVIETHLSREVMRSRLASMLNVERHSLSHALLASCDPHHVVTTNYDRLVEEAFGEERRPAVLPREPVGPSGRWVLKLHGDIENSDSIVLTRSDYMGLPSGSQALLGIMQAMLMTQHMLFVGYSLQDETFHRVMFDVRKAFGSSYFQSPGSTKFGTVLLVAENQLVSGMWENSLDVVALHTSDSTEGGRNLEIVLDLVGFECADTSAFLLDATFDSLLTGEERLLRKRLGEVIDAAGDGGPVGAQVLARLTTLLGNPADLGD